MKYSALLSPEEARLLLGLQDKPLDSLGTDGWGAYVCSGAPALAFLPEEVPAPDALHPHGDVKRVRVEPGTSGTRGPGYGELARSLGRIRRLSLMTTAITFSPPVHSAAVDLLGVRIPAGMGYSPLYLHPDDPACDALAAAPNLALSLVDIGILMETEESRVTIATDGCGYFVYATVGESTHERLLDLDGKVRLAPVTLCRCDDRT